MHNETSHYVSLCIMGHLVMHNESHNLRTGRCFHMFAAVSSFASGLSAAGLFAVLSSSGWFAAKRTKQQTSCLVAHVPIYEMGLCLTGTSHYAK